MSLNWLTKRFNWGARKRLEASRIKAQEDQAKLQEETIASHGETIRDQGEALKAHRDEITAILEAAGIQEERMRALGEGLLKAQKNGDELSQLKKFLGVIRYEKTQENRVLFNETGLLPDLLNRMKQFHYQVAKLHKEP